MNTRYRILVLIVIIVVMWKLFTYFTPDNNFSTDFDDENIAASSNTEKIKVSVYYEALCSDSRFFIMKQLVPAHEAISNSIILDLVPYGKAQTIEKEGQITFHCQHAELECLANKIHACGIDYIKDSNLKLKYVACMINDNMVPRDAGQKCAVDLGIDFAPIIKCVDNRNSSLLLKAHGERTHALDPPVRFIPTVELNGNQNIAQSLILKDLLKELCNLLVIKPKLCL